MDDRYHPEDLKLLVRVLRAFRQWDQAELALAAGLDPCSISHYETGRTVPSRKNLESLAAAAGVPMSFVDHSLLPALAAGRSSAAKCLENFDNRERAFEALGSVVALSFRPALGELLEKLDPRRPPWEWIGPPGPEDRNQGDDLWERLKPLTMDQRRFLVESCREFHHWALMENLCHESAKAAPGEALALAELACRVAELSPGGESWRTRLMGYALGYLANAKRLNGDLAGAEETFTRAWKLWEAGAPSDRGVLEEVNLRKLEAALRRDLGSPDA